MINPPFSGIQAALYLFILVLFVQCTEERSVAAPPPTWGGLEAGPYTVGFRTLFVHDATKPPVPYSDWDGRLYPSPETTGRQMQINLWYPAQRASQARQLKIGDYIDLMGQQTDFTDLDDKKASFANQQFLDKVNALGGNGTFNQEKLDSLRALMGFAFHKALPMDGAFPLVVFPNGGSPAFQSIMCEFLASHGFIVGAMALKGTRSFTAEATFRGLESAVADLDFGLRQLVLIPQVDPDRIAMIANAITSSQIVAYQSRNASIDAIISLEGGVLSQFEQNILRQTAFYDPEAVDVPILAIYAPHPNIDPEHIFHLKYSERYFLHFPQMTEFHFLNFGPLDRFIPNIIGSHDGDVQKGYELGCNYSLHFLNAYLNDDLNSINTLREGPAREYHAHIDTFFVVKALPKPPGITTIKDGFIRHGFSYIDSVYQHHKVSDPAPFSSLFYDDFKNWLAWKKDPDFEYRYQLYLRAFDSFPESAMVNYYLGYFALETDRKEEAKEHYQKTLQYIETDDDPRLTKTRKATMLGYISEDMKSL